jgi:hypothetical protein
MLFYSLPCTGLRIHDRMEYVTISSICCFILYRVRASVSMIVWNINYLQYMLFYSLPCTGLRINDRMEYVTISSICCFILYHVRASVSMIVLNM